MIKKIMIVVSLLIIGGMIYILGFHEKTSNNTKTPAEKKKAHHLNIPESGIQSMMESNSQKFIEGTDGSVIITIGDVTRKKVDITIKRDDKILDERIVNEKEKMTFDYEGNVYTIEVVNLKKPLLGVGKAEITIK